MLKPRLLSLLLTLVMPLVVAGQPASARNFDLLIRNGMVYDGTGKSVTTAMGLNWL